MNTGKSTFDNSWIKPAILRNALCIGMGLLCWAPARGQSVNIYSSADTVSVGDRFYLSITAEHNGVAQLSFPDPAQGDTVLGDLVVIRRGEIQSRAMPGNDPGLRMDSIVYEVTTFALDSASVPPLPISFQVAERTYTVGTPPLRISVRSLVPQDAQDVRDIKDIEDFPRPWWFWPLVALAILAVTALIVWLVRRKPRKQEEAPVFVPPPRVLTPYEEAEERLQRLEQADLAEPGATRLYYIELADILRTYFAKRLDIAALECTSRELLMILRKKASAGRVPEQVPAETRAIMDVADLVKFAHVAPSPAQSQQILQQTRRLVQLVEESQRSPEPADAAASAHAQSGNGTAGVAV
jgi:hypothetical protein